MSTVLRAVSELAANPFVVSDLRGQIHLSNRAADASFLKDHQLSSPIWLGRLNECVGRGFFETYCDARRFCKLTAIGRHTAPRILIEVTDVSQDADDAKVLDEHQNRLSQLSIMAAGIAHEVNNPMTVIYARVQLIMAQIEAGHTTDRDLLRTSFEKILQQSERVTKIVRSLQRFSRNALEDPVEPRSVYLIVEEALTLANARIRDAGIAVKLALPAGDVQIYCRESQMLQVLLILINNSADALRDHTSPEITITVEDGNPVRIQVLDNGPGVPCELEDRIFVPFFTTKKVGDGTGIGLSIASKIVKEHGGTLRLNRQTSSSCFEFTIAKAP